MGGLLGWSLGVISFHTTGVQEGLASGLIALACSWGSLMILLQLTRSTVPRSSCVLDLIGGPIQPSAFLKSAAGLSHCCSGLSLGCGLGDRSTESNRLPLANKAFSLEESRRQGDFFSLLSLGLRPKPHLFLSACVSCRTSKVVGEQYKM